MVRKVGGDGSRLFASLPLHEVVSAQIVGGLIHEISFPSIPCSHFAMAVSRDITVQSPEVTSPAGRNPDERADETLAAALDVRLIGQIMQMVMLGGLESVWARFWCSLLASRIVSQGWLLKACPS